MKRDVSTDGRARVTPARQGESVYDFLLRTARKRGAAFVVLVDPDRLDVDSLPAFCERCAEAGVDAFFVGSSILRRADFDHFCVHLRKSTTVPTIGFPGSIAQVSSELDAILFLSIVSGRNAEYLFGQHVHAAPVIRRLGVEAIPTAYMLVESGATTTAQYMSHSLPLPANKPDVAAATALAAEMLGMRMLFTDAGSGAPSPVPIEIIRAISETCTSPIVVGGGLRTPEAVRERAEAGASVIVIGNAVEHRSDVGYLTELGFAAHVAQARRG
jgi:putative glycerol-1-phosphate prenyltransferase